MLRVLAYTNLDRTITLPDTTATLVGSDASGNVGIGGYTTDGTTNSLRIGNVADYQGRVWLNSVDEKLTIENTSDYANGGVSIKTNGTERFKVTTDGRGLSQFTAKAWVNFNGMGTVAIRDSHNVSSITDLAFGVYRVNFSNALSNANYSIGGSVVGNTQSYGFVTTTAGTTSGSTPSTSGFDCAQRHYSGTLFDVDWMHLIVFGD